MEPRVPHIIIILILAQVAIAFIFNDSRLFDNDIEITNMKTRRKEESTSSSGGRSKRGGAGPDSKTDEETLDQSFSDESASSSDDVKKGRKRKKHREPKSTIERKGWRKWHRKCTKCPEDMHKKWRDPSIKWICGGYQRARRTFKSLCMMHYRNCQDGTMFTKIGDHRCPNASGQIRPYGDHFFYDYKVVLSEDSKTSATGSDLSESEEEPESSSSWSSSRIATIPPLRF